MRRLLRTTIRLFQTLAIVMLALLAYLIVRGALGEQPVHALPEYSPRTGETCAACHVSAGGGGPRTLPGMLWAARGRPDEMPLLPGLLIAPGVTDGLELYDVGCAGCHGYSRDGLFAIGLANGEIPRAALRNFTRNGIPELGMPAFEGQFTDAQLESLLDFLIALGVIDQSRFSIRQEAA